MWYARAITWLLNGLRTLLASRYGAWIAGAAVWLGISLGSQTVIVGPVLDQVTAYAQDLGQGSDLGTVAAAALAWVGVLKFDIFLTMVLSAIATKHSIGATKLFLQRRS